MAVWDLKTLSLEELQQLEKDVAKAIATFWERQKSEARVKLDALAREMGYSLGDLVASGRKRVFGPAKAKYRHPSSLAITWSGRGRWPQWFRDHVDAGRDPGDLEI